MDSEQQIEALLDKASATKDGLEAISYFEEVLRINPLHAGALTRIAAAYSLLGRNRECLDFVRRAVFIDPTMTNAWPLHEHALLELGIKDKKANQALCDEQLAWCENYVKRYGTVPQGWYLKAFTLTFLDKSAEALTTADQLCEISPIFPDGFYLRGCILLDLGRRKEAAEALSQAQQLGHPKAADTLKQVLHSMEPAVIQEEAYQGIVQTCRRCQELMDVSVDSTGLNTEALGKIIGPSIDLWRAHDRRISEPVRLEGADFRRLLFPNQHFKKHAFVNCDFSGSRWFMAGFMDADCSGSSFAGITTFLFGMSNSDCTGCNFSQAKLQFGFSIENTKFCGADFSGATLQLTKMFVAPKVPPDFTGAVMTGCNFINDSPHAGGAFKRWFSKSQRAVMSVGPSKARSGCFIATAACGAGSDEVAILREYRDRVLLATSIGRVLVRCYYCASPIIAQRIEASNWLRAAVRSSVVIPAAEIAKRRLRDKRECKV